MRPPHGHAKRAHRPRRGQARRRHRQESVEEVYGQASAMCRPCRRPSAQRPRPGAGDERAGSTVGRLFDHICDWLTKAGDQPIGAIKELSPDAAGLALLQAMMGGRETDYLRAQAETLEYLEWLKNSPSPIWSTPRTGRAASKTNGGGGAEDATGSDAGRPAMFKTPLPLPARHAAFAPDQQNRPAIKGSISPNSSTNGAKLRQRQRGACVRPGRTDKSTIMAR